ncbi:HOG (high osmolarity glycerol) pathway protein [Friedmanniomyces endolithicus]|nr:HOG (high osmolarity glycerol) pathway protein [Friedmanniomyces endolithicus]
MTEVLPPPTSSIPPTTTTTTTTTTSPLASPQLSDSTNDPLASSLPRRPAPRERIPSHGQNRMSTHSRVSHSESTTIAASLYPTTLSQTHIRDFAWPAFHPLHYGAPDDDSASGATTPGSEWQSSSRRLSDPLDHAGSSGWSAGPWGGDGVMYGDPEHDDEHEPLPSTSFGDESGDASDETGMAGNRKKRKSKSYANMSDYERGRRRESAGFRRSRASGEAAAAAAAAGSDMFMFMGRQSDLAGRDSLRQSRGYVAGTNAASLQPSENGAGSASSRARAESHFQTVLPSRSFPNSTSQCASQAPAASQPSHLLPQTPGTPFDPDTTMPLDTEKPSLPPPQNPRESLGPEDEELYAGRSLALYPFEPENSNELRLREGQVIMVSYRHGQGWLVAEDPESGEQGLVPEEYVRLLSELPHFDERTGEFLETGEGEEVLTAGEEHDEAVARLDDGAGRRGAVAGDGRAGGGEHEGEAADDEHGDVEGREKEEDTRVDTPEAYELDAGDVPAPAKSKAREDRRARSQPPRLLSQRKMVLFPMNSGMAAEM